MWFDVTHSPLHDEAGATGGVLVSLVQADDSKLADRQVGGQRRLFDQAPGFISISRGPEHVYEFVNAAYAQLCGQRDYLGKTVREVLPDIADQRFYELLDAVYATGERFVADRLAVRIGQIAGVGIAEERFVNFIYEPMLDAAGKVMGVFTQGYDIMAADLVQEARREAEALAERSAERDRVWRNALDVMVVADANGVFLAASPAWMRVLGHDVSEVIGRNFRDFVCSDDAEPTMEAIATAVTGIDVAGFENRYRHKDGSMRTLAWRTSAEDSLIYGYARDVTTERMQAAELAKRVAERERLWTTNPMLFAVAAYDSTILEVNPAWTTLLGWTPEDLIGRSYAEYVHPDDADRSLDWARRLASGLKVEALENRYRCKDGGTRWIAWTITADDEMFHCVGRDVTEQRLQAQAVQALEANLRQAQKMEAVGQLTGGIAHDFNNMLMGVLGSLEIVQRRIASGRFDDIDRYLDAARQSGERAAGLTKRLLAFSRNQSLNVRAFDADALTRGMECLLQQTLGGQGEVTIGIPSDLWPIEADASQLESALLNLALNARDAMPNGGRLTIDLANVRYAEADQVRSLDLEPGDYVSIAVRDTGEGMPQNVIDRAFDPFFTTKLIGEGTGLGLSMIFGFAKQSNGHVAIDSEVGRGTTVTLFLPRAVDAVVTKGNPNAKVLSPAPMGATILVVDDEDQVRQVMTDVLADLGYQLIQAVDGDRALHTLQSDQNIDLMITDVGLPGMNGRQLSEMARQLRPGLKILFVTGYAAAASIQGGLNDGTDLLCKPFSLDVFAEKVTSMLAGADSL